jgi:hypothetical protein
LAASEEFRLTAIDAEKSIKCDRVVFAYSARAVQATKRTALDGWRDVPRREREHRGGGFTLRETLSKTTLFGRTRVLLRGIRLFCDINSGGKV